MRCLPLVSRIIAVTVLGLAAGCHQIDPGNPPRPLTVGAGAKAGRRQDANVQVAMGRTAELRGDLDSAMASYHAALKNDPHRADAHQRLAVVHDRLGRFQESAGYYVKALAAAPGDAEIFCDKGYSLYLQRRWAEADICLRQAIALQPKLARAHNNLGLLLAKDGKVDEALAEFRAGGLRTAEAHQNAAFVMSTEKRWDEARHHYELAIAANPSATAPRDRLAELTKVTEKLHAPPANPKRDGEVLTTSAKQPPMRKQQPGGAAPAGMSQNKE